MPTFNPYNERSPWPPMWEAPEFHGPVILSDSECLIWGCREPIFDRHYCDGHYQEWRKTARLFDLTPKARCTRQGCTGEQHAKGICKNHYNEIYNAARRARREAARMEAAAVPSG